MKLFQADNFYLQSQKQIEEYAPEFMPENYL